MFDLLAPCKLDMARDKTSQKGVISVTNGHSTEVLLRAVEGHLFDWISVFKEDVSLISPHAIVFN